MRLLPCSVRLLSNPFKIPVVDTGIPMLTSVLYRKPILMRLAITGPDYSPYSPPRACEWHGWCISTYFCVVGLVAVYNVALCTCRRRVLQAAAPLL